MPRHLRDIDVAAGCAAGGDQILVDLLIVDEVGFVPFERHVGELLFNVLASPA